MGTFSKRWDKEEDENDGNEQENYTDPLWNQKRMGHYKDRPKSKNKCTSCESELNHLPFICKYCNKTHCGNCRMPEEHNCNFSNKKKNRKKTNHNLRKKYNGKQHYRKISKKKEYFLEKRKHLLSFLLILIIFAIIFITIETYSCEEGERKYQGECITSVSCNDETLSPECAKKQPLQCKDGELVSNAELCGCPIDYKINGNKCSKIVRCEDSTILGECSKEKPLFCKNRKLVNHAPICGCENEESVDGENCISKYMVGGKEINLDYIVGGRKGTISFQVYGGLDEYLSNIPRSISYYDSVPTTKDFILKNIDNDEQEKFLTPLVNKIKEESSIKSEQAKIAISLVQNIPYDWQGFNEDSLNSRYAYEVLFDYQGVCGEKSELMAFLLRELGYDVSLLSYESQNHQALGISCPNKFSLENSGYCFVESTSPSIITDSEGDYIGAGKLSKNPEIIPISEGKTLNDVEEEYEDAKEYNQIIKMGSMIDSYNYGRWEYLIKTYGIIID